MEEGHKEKVVKYAEKVLEALKVIQVTETPGVREILELAEAYLRDSIHFAEKNMLAEAYEALGIGWAYIDALLHLGVVKLKDKSLLKLFTLGGGDAGLDKNA